ncbi:hypothetical protein PBT90_13085 [Algoriphagus halophytocola]|uniref:hypothetical protein n=1 Tax=Algoriphagus halophytocola TaxID=2991499 RepID=UPI0022DE1CE9|nr:hypothetical protein [Algoriphagus sp. TR-M9]WBL41689.1 hypothetical protein PBT90_13085 [Algoriphagus sp. TR-M9]
MNTTLTQTKEFLFKNTWVLWLIIFLAIVSFSYSIRTGLLATGLIANGLLIGHVVLIGVLVLKKRTPPKYLLLPILGILIITISIYLTLDNKIILYCSIPLCIPSLVAGLGILKK